MEVLPVHEPCGASGLGEPTGERMDVVCTTRRRWFQRKDKSHYHEDAPGCGGVFVLDPRTGVRLLPERT